MGLFGKKSKKMQNSESDLDDYDEMEFEEVSVGARL